jgi:hypothetical protein
MREVVGSSPTATTTVFANILLFFRHITRVGQSHQQFTHDVILGIFAQGVASRSASKTCLQGFAEVLHGRFHALRHRPGVESRGIQARMAH